ncbi:MAG: DsrE family protein [Thermomicrobiales bacterium]
MIRMAIVILAGTETHADLGRAVNALLAVKEAKEAGDAVRLIFDGAGTKWIAELSDPTHSSHVLYESVEDQITGVCQYCAKAFGATDAVRAAGVPLLDEYQQHPSLRNLIADGFQVLIF